MSIFSPIISIMTNPALHIYATHLPDANQPSHWWVTPNGTLTAHPIADAVDVPGRYLLPGMVDAHSHLSMSFGLVNHPDASPDVIRANIAAKMRQGISVIRDTGALPNATISPSQYWPAHIITTGNMHAPANRYFPGIYHPVEADGLVAAALRELEAGTRWIKIIADFPWPDFNFYRPIVNYDFATLKSLCDAIHAEGGRVAAHVSGPHVAACVRAGIDSIEHGNMIDGALLAEMAQRGTAWVPTLATITFYGKQFLQAGGQLAEDARQNDSLMRQSLALAEQMGVTLLVGTDEKPDEFVHEVQLMHEYGVSPKAALVAATDGARAYFGLPSIAEGAPADVVLFNDDPRDDLGHLAAPVAVIAGGRHIAP